MKVNKFLFFIIIFIIFNQLSFNAETEEIKKTFIISAPIDLYPFYFKNEAGKADGLYIDIWKLWAKKTNTNIKFELNNWNNSLQLLKNKKADIHAGCFYSPEREKYMDYVYNLKEIETHIFHDKSIPVLDTVDSLKPFKIGIIKGDYSEFFLKSNLKDISNIKFYKTYDELMRGLINKEIFVFIMDTPNAIYFLNKYNLTKTYAFSKKNFLYKNDVFATVKKGDIKLAKKIKDGLKNISIDERRTIERKWLFYENSSKNNSEDDFLVVSFPRSYYPFSFVENFSEPKGVLVDIWKLWSEKTGIKIKFLSSDWNESLELVKNGIADIHSGVFFTDSRDEYLSFSNSIYEIKSSIFINQNKYKKHISDLNNITLGTLKGSYYYEFLTSNYPDINTIQFENFELGAKALVNNSIEGFFCPTLTFENYLDDNLKRKIKKNDNFTITNKLYAGVLKNNFELLKLINKGINKITSEELNSIEAKWISDPQNRIYNSLNELEKNWIKNNPIIQVGVSRDYYPFEYLNDQNKFTGISYDFFKASLNGTGLKFNLIFDKPEILKEKLKNKNIDIILNVISSDGDSDFINFSSPYLISDTAVLTFDKNIDSTKKFKNNSFVVRKNSFFEKYLKENFPKLKIISVENYSEAIDLIFKKEADAFIDNYNFLNSLSIDKKTIKMDINKISDFPKLKISFGTRDDLLILKNLIEKQLNLINNNIKTNIFNKYLKSNPNYTLTFLNLNELKWIKENPNPNITVLRNNPPFSFIENNVFKGIIIDYIRLFEKQLNINFNLVPVDNLNDVIDMKNVNFIAEIPNNKFFNNSFITLENYFSSPLVIITRNDYPIISNLKNMKNKKLVIPKRYFLEKNITQKYPSLKLLSVDNVEYGLNMIKEKKADIMLINIASLSYFIKKFDFSKLKVSTTTNYSYNIHFGIRKNKDIPIEIFDNLLKNINPREKEKIYEKWLGTNLNFTHSWKYLIKTISLISLIFLIVLLAIIYWNRKLKKEIKRRKYIESNLLKLTQAIEQSPTSLIITDNKFIIEYVNEAFCKLTGYKHYELVDKELYFIDLKKEIEAPLIHGEILFKEIPLITKCKKELIVQTTISPIYTLSLISNFVFNIVDITERRLVEKAKQHQVELERLFADISTHLIIHSMKDIDYEIEYGLERVGKFSNVDRSYLFLLSPDKRIIYNTHEWRAKGVKSQLDILKGLFPFPWFMDKLNEFKNIHIPSVKNLDEDSGIFKEVLMKENIKSLLFVPVRYSQELLGFVGFDTFKKEKSWTKEDISVLKIFSDIFANALARKNIETKLKEAKEKADSANKAKSHFLANMSHEIRTPMNAILGITHLLSQTMLNKKQSDYVKKITQSANNLLNIINDILDFSKIEAGKIEFESIEFSLNEVLENLANIINIKAQNKNIEIIIKKDTHLPEYLIGDSLRLGQVLLNLTNNSIKFTDKGEVIITVEKESETKNKIILKFSVKDTGTGIEESKLSNLFKSFSQADSSTTRKYGGTGLGLSISKKLVEMMNGKIHVESKINEGSNFYFTSEFKKSNRVKAEYVIPSIDFRNLKALIFDKNINAANTLKEYLISFSFNVDIVLKEEEIFDLIQKNKYNFFIIDVSNSLEFKEQIVSDIKKLISLDTDPKFILTTKYSTNSFIGLDNFGFHDSLLKPITQSTIFNSIINILGIDAPEFRKKQEKRSTENIQLIKGSKILLVEDNEINQQVALEILQKKGFLVDIAKNGQEAINKLINFDHKKYDIILMDIQMPVLDGYEATKKIRNELNIKKIPILAMTADALKGVEKQCIEAGMNDYISKPIIPKNLFKKLKKWIKKDSDFSLDKDSNITSLNSSIEEHLDFNEGMKRIDNNKKLYLSLLNKFYDNNMETSTLINSLFYEKNNKELIQIIHTLKGVSGNIAAKKLFSLCNNTLSSLKNNNEDLEKSLVEVNSELIIVLNKIKEILSKETDSTEQNTKEVFKEKNYSFYKLLELLKDDDIDALDYFDKISDTFKSESYFDEFINLKNFIHNYEFEEAISELNLFLKKHNLLEGE